MLFWVSIAIFAFSVSVIWNNSMRKKNARELKLRAVRSKIEASEKAKKLTSPNEELTETVRKSEEHKNTKS